MSRDIEYTPEGIPDYHSDHMVPYQAPGSWGYTSLEVLPFLKGMKWGPFALAWVHSLRPTSIRVTTGMVKCDSRIWRVTVYVDENDIIKEIEQEVEVGLYGWPHGGALHSELDRRLAGKPPRSPDGRPVGGEDAFFYAPYLPQDITSEEPQEVEALYGEDCEDELVRALADEIVKEISAEAPSEPKLPVIDFKIERMSFGGAARKLKGTYTLIGGGETEIDGNLLRDIEGSRND